ncbi:MAG: hypothetical protein Q8R32_03865 [bacterium]|nr:hypothetical protein [bacterium]
MTIARGAETQAAVSARAGLSDRTIGLIETKKLKKPPRPITIARLAIAMGQDPKEWLGCVGLTMRDEDIERLRGQIKTKAKWEELEPAAEIKRQLKSYIDQVVAPLESAAKLRGEVMEYIDARCNALTMRLASLEKTVYGAK